MQSGINQALFIIRWTITLNRREKIQCANEVKSFASKNGRRRNNRIVFFLFCYYPNESIIFKIW